MKIKKDQSDEIIGSNEFDYSEEDAKELPEYGKRKYWDDRYQSENQLYDWYFDWNYVSPFVKQITENRKNNVLVLGCGNSSLSYEMAQEGFHSIYSIDISSVVIEQMKEKYKDQPNLIWETMNCASLKYEDNFFDLCIDKGTLDAVVCHPKDTSLVSSTLKEVYRTLKPNGAFISITFGSPSRRLPFFNLVKLNWKLLPPIQLKFDEKYERDIHHYIYTFQKS